MATDTQIRPKTRLYFSDRDDYQITRVKATEIALPTGGARVTDTGKVYKFQNNFLRLEEGQDMLPTGPAGEMEDAPTWLERQWSYGLYYQRQDEGAPDAGPVHQQITALAIAGDLQGLDELHEQEFANWAREDVGVGVINALEGLYRATEDEARQQEIQAVYHRVAERQGYVPPEADG